MKKIQEFKKHSVISSSLESIIGGLKDIKTELKNDKEEILYTDVHHDNDNDGEWSAGDSFDLTMA